MNIKLFLKSLVCSTLISLSSQSYASVSSDLNKFFEDLSGGGANVSSATVIKGQQAGYLVGGSIYARMPIRNIQLISISMPSVSAGCGGIDAYLGAFSYINSDQLQAMAKMILSNAIGYAFDLALETTCPQCKNVMNTLRQYVQQANDLNISTCQAAQGLVNSTLGNALLADNSQCKQIATDQGLFSDWTQAMQRCGTGGETNSVLNKAKGDTKEEVRRNINQVWQAFTRVNQAVTNDRELKEMMMTMIGTIVYDAQGNMTIFPPLGASDEFINAIMYGGQTVLYRCNDETSCLKPTKSKTTISESNALVPKTRSLLNSIYDKRFDKSSSLTSREISLVENTPIPIISYMTTVAQAGVGQEIILNLSEYIAINYALSYTKSLLDVTEIASSTSLQTNKEAAEFRERVRSVREKLNNKLAGLEIQQNQALSSIQQIMILKKNVSSKYNNMLAVQ